MAPDGFDAFFERSFPSMMARALILCGHRQDAEDAVQEAYAEAFRRWERLRGYDAPDAWVYRIVRQRLSAVSRRKARWRPAELDSIPHPPAAGVEQAVEARAVLSALAALPRRQRTVLVLHCLQGMSQEAIADELGLSRGGVAASLFKARKKLKKVLGMPDRGTGGAGELGRARDELISTDVLRARLAEAPAGQSGDPLTERLHRTEVWLRGGFTAERETMARIHERIRTRTSQHVPGQVREHVHNAVTGPRPEAKDGRR
ncbi:RNA polymerase sigma factor [Streptomyces sp. 7N604]|uniref:RNA polymerase sigma factor n=1 Tax=Streptomyces sp. 7N604 TaxID=3457415 RepID=UPI003FD5836B